MENILNYPEFVLYVRYLGQLSTNFDPFFLSSYLFVSPQELIKFFEKESDVISSLKFILPL